MYSCKVAIKKCCGRYFDILGIFGKSVWQFTIDLLYISLLILQKLRKWPNTDCDFNVERSRLWPWLWHLPILTSAMGGISVFFVFSEENKINSQKYCLVLVLIFHNTKKQEHSESATPPEGTYFFHQAWLMIHFA